MKVDEGDCGSGHGRTFPTSWNGTQTVEWYAPLMGMGMGMGMGVVAGIVNLVRDEGFTIEDERQVEREAKVLPM